MGVNAKETKGRESVSVNVISYNGSELVPSRKDIIEESRYRLIINGEYEDTMTCSPWEVKEAVIGYLFMKEYIGEASDVKSWRKSADGMEIHVWVSAHISPYGPGNQKFLSAIESDTRLSVKEVLHLSRKLEEKSGLFHRTGGVHCAAFARGSVFLSYKEDVSRHVAVDKVVGDCLLRGISMEGGILVFSGRVPAEILQKVASMGCPVIIAKSAPTACSCQMAQRLGVTLIGFARDQRFNIYTHPERIYQ